MRNLMYFIATVLVMAWLVGFVIYKASGVIHILLLLAFITVLWSLIADRKLIET